MYSFRFKKRNLNLVERTTNTMLSAKSLVPFIFSRSQEEILMRIVKFVKTATMSEEKKDLNGS
jgi:hypothetical protein